MIRKFQTPEIRFGFLTANWLLGIQIEFLESEISLSQTAYINKILKKFGIFECSKVLIPVDPNHKLYKTIEDDKTTDTNHYQQILGSIMYTIIGTRPDLVYTITLLSQYASNPSAEHLGALKRVLRYLKGTRDQKLLYSYRHQHNNPHLPLILSGYTDSNFAGCRNTRHSTSRYIFKLGHATIY